MSLSVVVIFTSLASILTTYTYVHVTVADAGFM